MKYTWTPRCDWEDPQDCTPGEPTHIVAYRCDKCATTKTLLLCYYHTETWLDNYPRMYCPVDSGTLSYKIHTIATGNTTCLINPQ